MLDPGDDHDDGVPVITAKYDSSFVERYADRRKRLKAESRVRSRLESVSRKRREDSSLPESRDEEFKRAWTRGDPISEMCREFGMSASCVDDWRSRFGLPKRKHWGKPDKRRDTRVSVMFDKKTIAFLQSRVGTGCPSVASYLRKLVSRDMGSPA